MRRPRLGAALALAAALLVSGCTAQQAPPAPAGPELPAPYASATPTPTPRPDRDFTVGTTDAITVLDPAAMTTGSSQAIAFSVFQRLMTTPSGQDLLKPDAARDCIFEQATVYTCTLLDGLRFHSGRPVTSADVKFSIERAKRLAVPGSGASQLASISSIQTPDPRTVRFVLSYADNDIGYALASPVASIVDPSVYKPDKIADANTKPSGSGPYRFMAGAGGVWTFARFESYQGYSPANVVRVVLHEYPGSAQLEQALADGTVDVAWRGLSQAATIRLRNAADAADQHGGQPVYVPQQVVGSRIIRIEWNPASKHVGDATVRAFVNQALADRRTLTSIMPPSITGAVEGLYPAGGVPTLPHLAGAPLALTLGYDPRMPDGSDLAAELATSLDDTHLAKVTVRPNAPGSSTGDADLQLVDTRAATWTPRAWLAAYIDRSAASRHAQEVATMLTHGLTSTDQPTRTAATHTIQVYAAEDAYVMPLSQSDEYVFVRHGYSIDLNRLGTGWQLDLAAFSRTP